MIRATFSFLLTALIFALPGCGPSDGGADSAGGTAAGTGGEATQYTIAVVPKGLGHQFWDTVHEGAKAAGRELGAEIIWNGPPKETQIGQQINIIEDMINNKVDAIVMAACDENALVPTIEKAMNAGIPVVTIDSGVQSNAPVSFVATDNVAAANQAADTLADLIGGSGKVGLIPFVPGAATSEMREQGFKEGLEDHLDVTLAATIHCYSDVAKALAATEDMMTATPDLKGIFAANEAACIGAMTALETAEKAGDIKLVAFDASKEQIDGLKRGTVQALIVQDPFAMGRQGVEAAIDYIEGREVETRIDTGVTVVTADNLDDPAVQKLLNPAS